MLGRFVLLAMLCGVAEPVYALDAPANIIIVNQVTMVPAVEDVVGNRHAGLMCLPNGSVRGRDLAEGLSAGQPALVNLLNAKSIASVSDTQAVALLVGGETRFQRSLSIEVKSAKLNVCAKKWGLGDAKSYSGTAKFEFIFRLKIAGQADQQWEHTDDLEVKSKEAMRLGDFLVRSLEAAMANSVEKITIR